MSGSEMDLKTIETIINDFNKKNIPVRFTLTNCCIQKEHLKDEYCNSILKIADNGMNEITINNPLLEQYLRENFPNFKYISSTTKCLLKKEDIEKEIEKYYLTVLDYRKNIDFNFLQNLNNKDKYEILINAYCSPSCY